MSDARDVAEEAPPADLPALGRHPETLNRIEQGKHSASVPTIDKLDRALKAGETRQNITWQAVNLESKVTSIRWPPAIAKPL